MDNIVVLQQTEQPADWFGSFWTIYPRREAKKDALRAWSKVRADDYSILLEALVQWRNVWRQQNRTTNLIPLPATWLNGERWTDEIPPELQTHTAKTETVQRCGPVSLPARGPIPLSVQKVLDQLKAKR